MLCWSMRVLTQTSYHIHKRVYIHVPLYIRFAHLRLFFQSTLHSAVGGSFYHSLSEVRSSHMPFTHLLILIHSLQ